MERYTELRNVYSYSSSSMGARDAYLILCEMKRHMTVERAKLRAELSKAEAALIAASEGKAKEALKPHEIFGPGGSLILTDRPAKKISWTATSVTRWLQDVPQGQDIADHIAQRARAEAEALGRVPCVRRTYSRIQ